MLQQVSLRQASPYDVWIESLGLPIHTGYYVEDVRTIELGWWEERQCNTAFLKLAGQEGVTEARITEIPAGATLPPVRFGLDEVVYVVEGRGLATVQGRNGRAAKTFEWQKHSLFLVPRNYTHQFSNVQGNAPARLLHYNYLPTAMAVVPDPGFYLRSPYEGPDVVSEQEVDFYSEAKVVTPSGDSDNRGMAFWVGNFFPNMRSWDQLVPFRGRGAGGHVVWIRYPSTTITNHMSVFPAQTYKKAHRHGPGVVIIIPAGEGYSVMWPEGQEKVFIPWHEGSVFVPPNRWFHQHFNVGSQPGRYLAFHAPRNMSTYSERVEDRARDQIEYPDEDPWIRETFGKELAKRGLTSLLPEIAYQEREFEWEYGQQGD
ncbi:MAG: cupin domain-containing protein [Chloroflexi bacterium]|nr:cupin domain-containing protein [Chloroflexota bacterium]